MVWYPTPPVERRDAINFLFASHAFKALLVLSLLITAGVCAVTYWAFDNVPPYEYSLDDSMIVPPVAKAGSQVTVKWRVKVNRLCPGTLQRTLFEPAGAQIATYDVVLVADSSSFEGGYLARTFTLPGIMPRGKTGYRAAGHYHCNFLQRFFPLTVVTPDLYFEVE